MNSSRKWFSPNITGALPPAGALLDGAIDAQMAFGDERIEDAGEAVAVGESLAEAHAFSPVGIRHFRHALAHPLNGEFMQHARGLAILAAREAAIHGISHAPVEPYPFAGFRVDRRAVIVRRKEQHGAIGHHLIDHLASEVVLAKNAGIPAVAPDPVALGFACRETAEHLLEFRDGARAGEIDIERVAGSRILQMDMSVLKAGSTSLPPASMIRVVLPASALISTVDPSAMIRPPCDASAEAMGFKGSMVLILPLMRMRSGVIHIPIRAAPESPAPASPS
jgi:hypothetical protein